MKFQKLVPLALLAFSFSALTFTACKKDETDPNNNNNNNNNNNTEWNWTGTAPFSMKIDGTNYTYDTALAWKLGGFTSVSAMSDTKTFSVSFPDGASAGTDYSVPTSSSAMSLNNDLQATDPSTATYACMSGGKIKIISISGTEVEGKFYGTLKNMSNSTTKEAKEGYFKIKF